MERKEIGGTTLSLRLPRLPQSTVYDHPCGGDGEDVVPNRSALAVHLEVHRLVLRAFRVGPEVRNPQHVGHELKFIVVAVLQSPPPQVVIAGLAVQLNGVRAEVHDANVPLHLCKANRSGHGGLQ